MKQPVWRYLWRSEDLRRRLLYTLLLLTIYRAAANIPVPGINTEVLRLINTNGGANGNLFNLLDMLSGGTVSNFSILAMGVYPYITAQIILQLLVPIIPSLEQKMKDNPREGQAWMEKWTMILTVPIAMLSAIGQINIFNTMAGGQSILLHYGFTGDDLLPTITTLISMVAGTMFAIWLGQLISEYGIRNQGLSLIIFSGIVARIPARVGALLADESHRWLVLVDLVILAISVFAIGYVQQGQRNIPVLFPGRRVGNKMSMPVRSYLPLKVNMAGMIPLIFAQSLMTFPALVASYFLNSSTAWVKNFATWTYNAFNTTSGWYIVTYFLFVVIFTFFYTDVMFTQQNYGENLKRQGAQIPGVLRGNPTQKYLTRVQRRITLPWALFLGLVATMPYLLSLILPTGSRNGGFLVSSAGLLIVVGVIVDTLKIIDAELKLQGYDEKLIS
ncbi:MAG TPA: preprotein translocase subunit SecY [Anaerolineaceae bacterium]|nr:preprotein translocase subunit SecY [Anaerolineaceae bacterium]